MAITTYSQLQTAVEGWLNRTDLKAVIPDFIALAEAKFKRHRAVQDERRTTLTISGRVTTLPTDLRELTSLSLDSQSNRYGPLELVAPERLDLERAKWQNSGGVPNYASISSDGRELLVDRAPATPIVANIVYLTNLDSLSATQTTNWLLTGHPDVYLFGALVESAPYLKDDERVVVWKEKLSEALGELEDLVTRRRYSANSLVVRPPNAIGSRVHVHGA